MIRLSVPCIAILLTLGGISDTAVEGQGPANDIPELKVLNHYTGKWDSQITIKPNPAQPKGAQWTGSSVGEWIHEGRFMRQTWSSKASDGLPAMNGSTTMTYDPNKKIYRSWSFASTGQMGESQGSWDEQTQTMTWTMRDDGGGGSSVTKAAFPEDGVESWSIVAKDGTGKVVAELSGKNSRGKK